MKQYLLFPEGKSKALTLSYDDGVDTYTHPGLLDLKRCVLSKEISDDRAKLEEMFGDGVRGHAYPYGHYNDEIVDVWLRVGEKVVCVAAGKKVEL